jgi:hypothetical protein
MPEFAPFVALAFLGTAGLVFFLVLGAAAAAALRKPTLAKIAGAAGCVSALAYLAVLLAVSAASRDRTLKVGDWKYFCEIDCHLAYRLTGVASSPEGQFVRRTAELQVWFDPNTTAPWRGDSPLGPNPRTAHLLDGSGRRYDAPAEALRSLARPLHPGESASASLDFRVPAQASGPWRLFVGDPPGVETLLIGHENAPLHGRIYFDMEDVPAGSRRSG